MFALICRNNFSSLNCTPSLQSRILLLPLCHVHFINAAFCRHISPLPNPIVNLLLY